MQGSLAVFRVYKIGILMISTMNKILNGSAIRIRIRQPLAVDNPLPTSLWQSCH